MLSELRFAVRALLRSRAITAAAVVSVGLGISTLVGVVAIRRAILGSGLWLNQSNRVVHLFTSGTEFSSGRVWTVLKSTLRSAAENEDLFSAVAAYEEAPATIRGEDWAIRVAATYVSAQFMSIVGARASIGRTFYASEEHEGTGERVVLSEALWRQRFGADSAVVGQSMEVNGRSHTIVGVMASQTEFPERSRIWILASVDRTGRQALSSQLSAVAILKNHVSAEHATQVLSLLSARSEQATKRSPQRLRRVNAAPFREFLVSRLRGPLTMMSALSVLVVVLTAVNFATLLLARGIRRRQALGIRAALGASLKRLVWHSVAESIVLSAAGGLLGVLLAPYVLGALNLTLDGIVPPWIDLQLDWMILFSAVGCSVVMGALIGLIPAIELGRPAATDLLRSANTTSRATPRQSRGRRLLVGVQVTLATGTLVCVGTLYGRAFVARAPDMGFDQSNLLVGTASRDTASVRAPQDTRRASFIEDIAIVRGVAAVGVSRTTNVESSSLSVDVGIGEAGGNPRVPRSTASTRWLVWTEVSPEFFKAVRPKLLHGRFPTNDEMASGAPVGVVTELASTWLAGQDPLGSRIHLKSDGLARHTVTVVGVVGDIKEHAYYEFPSPMLFAPFPTNTIGERGDLTVWVRSISTPGKLASLIQSSLRVSDPSVALLDLRASRDVFADEIQSVRSVALVAAGVFVIGLALAVLGIYGIVAHGAMMRRPEIAIRAALGARTIQISALLLRETVRVVAIALTAGTIVGAIVAFSVSGDAARIALPAALSAALALIALAIAIGVAAIIPLRDALGISTAQVLRAAD